MPGFFLLPPSVLVLIMLFLFVTKRQHTARIFFTTVAAIEIIGLLYTGGSSGLGIYWLLIFPVFAIPLLGMSKGNLISFLFFLLVTAFFMLQSKLQVYQYYSFDLVIKILGAYAAIHLLVYLNEFLKFHNYTVMERTIIESKLETRQKDDFLSKLSHQIRTPLNNLTVISNLINKSKLDAEQRDLFDTISGIYH